MENNLRTLRRERGMTQLDIAERMMVTPGQVSRWEAGKSAIPSTRLQGVADAYGVKVEQIFGVMVQDDTVWPPTNARKIPMEGPSAERMREDLPIYGTALGSALMVEGEAIEQTTLNRGEVIHYAKRPTILDGRADAYGLYVQGSSMAPVHLEGDMILAETKRPPRIGDDVVVYLRAAEEDGDDDRARAVLVKRLVRRSASYIELEQFQPTKIFKIPSEDIFRIDRVMRLADLIG
jgi:transcriptional regulator with XRE-family HTH domain